MGVRIYEIYLRMFNSISQDCFYYYYLLLLLLQVSAANERDIEIELEKIYFITPTSHVLFDLLYKFISIISKSEYSKGLIIRISGHMCLIRYHNTCALIPHFSVAKFPITHCSYIINYNTLLQRYNNKPY